MCRQSVLEGVGLVAQVALVRPVLCVGHLVLDQVAGGRERLPALLAEERLDPVMHPHVLRQVPRPAERFITLFTLERFFARVAPHVLLERAGGREGGAALLTREGPQP